MSIRCRLYLTWLLVLALLALSLPISNIISSVAYGSTMVTHEIQSAAIARNIMGIPSLRRVVVYIPDGYEQGNQRYPVIYWIPGWAEPPPLFDVYRQPLDDAIQTGKIPPTIAVFIDVNEGTAFLNSPEFGYWEDFLISELIPFIDKTYRTVPDWRKRALMGHCTGGYNALILPILHPNIWGAVGSNDGDNWFGYNEFHIGKEGEVPEAMRNEVALMQGYWKNMPASIEDYKTTGVYQQLFIQLGVAISPNPAALLHFDVPVDKEGKAVPAALERWRAYCLMDPTTIAKHQATLRNLSMIAIVVPAANGSSSRRYQNLLMIDLMKAEGISATRLDMPGTHADYIPERFIVLAEQVLKSMGSVTSVEAKGKLPVAWGEIKKGKY
jgi:hypothetical protein